VRTRLPKIIAFRLVVSSLLLTSAMAIGIRAPDTFPVNPFVFLIGVTYALSGLYLATLRLAERSPAIVDLQFAADAVLVSAFIHVTGGITSHFSSLYILPIIAASTVRSRHGALQVAALSATLYTGMVFAQYLDVGVVPDGWWRPVASTLPPAGFAEYTVAINLAGMFGVALLAGSLAERLRSARAGLEDASFEIADLRAFNDHVIDCLASGVITADAKGRVLTFNRAAARITGVAPDEARDRDARELLQLPADVAGSLATLDPAKSRRVEIGFRARDGRPIDLGLSVATLQFPEGTAGYLFTFQDVTDLKRLERDARLQQRLAAVGEMAAGIAHEIRNPLASMAGSIEVLRQELPLTDEQQQLMDIALRESERLNERIRLFLAYARPQRHGTTRVDVRRVLHDSAQLLRNSVDLRAGHVIEVPGPAEPLWYECDEAEVRQILWSLGTNGLRAMPNGGRLRLQAQGGDAAGDDLVLSVQDEGCGIPSEELEAVFQPFRRSFEQGAGLGLAIVHRIATDYGGRVEVTSTVGAGTTVHVRLPRTAPTAGAPVAPAVVAAGRTA
jgi:two-component system sensor histidine kinase PilS (NtrC family)